MQKEKSELMEWLKAIVIAVVFVIAIRTFIFTPTLVSGASMMPTYEDGDRVVVNIIGKQISGLERFDVIVFKATEEKDYIKRIIGLPGDHIAYKDDVLYINGNPYDEPYLNAYKEQLIDNGTLTQDFTLEELTNVSTIPDGYLFVLGDNRRFSNDSRNPAVGLISMDTVIGKANIRFYPFDHFGIVK
ncbi:signal peptidase I [Solibacillus sp. R5-41]|uniref:signal peptidase I n=1 Tax=Solibacillus sp. R5-41 TaxID=2048654 RepID=UPI000C124C9B|nr:signal peptidase I [Solibacillus sp. R5-41]ATP39700.1 signal peptidase I [Solibacillus sp. R5-41]